MAQVSHPVWIPCFAPRSEATIGRRRENLGQRSMENCSGLGGIELCDPCRVGKIGGRDPWAAGTKNVPLPTATQFSPLRGSTKPKFLPVGPGIVIDDG